MRTAVSFVALAAVAAIAAPSRRGKCASGYTHGSTTTTMTINAPMTTMESITKSFFNAAWEGITGEILLLVASTVY